MERPKSACACCVAQPATLATRLAVVAFGWSCLLAADRSFNDTTSGRNETLLSTIAKRSAEIHTTGGIPRWSPTLVLVARFSAYVWQSGRDAQFSLTYGRMCCVKRMM